MIDILRVIQEKKLRLQGDDNDEGHAKCQPATSSAAPVRSSIPMPNSTGELSEESLPFKQITWKIPNFSTMPTKEFPHVRTSPEFQFANATWCLQQFPNGDEDKNSDQVNLYVERLHSSVPVHHIQYKISLRTSHGEVYESCMGESTFDHSHDVWGVVCYLQSSKCAFLRQLLTPNPTATVSFQIWAMEGAKEEAAQVESPEAASPPRQQQQFSHKESKEASCQTDPPDNSTQEEETQDVFPSVQKLQLDYKNLLQSGEDSDMCLKVAEKEFRAHKCILRARSKVFNSMFKYEMEENVSREVIIDDLDPDAFSDFLQHVYTGRVEALSDENVFHLYSAADKYDLQELKSECREYMKRTLSVDTFCDLTTLALRHQEQELLKLAIEFFSEYLTDIIVTVKWQVFSKDHNTEANELLVKALVPGKKIE